MFKISKTQAKEMNNEINNLTNEEKQELNNQMNDLVIQLKKQGFNIKRI